MLSWNEILSLQVHSQFSHPATVFLPQALLPCPQLLYINWPAFFIDCLFFFFFLSIYMTLHETPLELGSTFFLFWNISKIKKYYVSSHISNGMAVSITDFLHWRFQARFQRVSSLYFPANAAQNINLKVLISKTSHLR